MSSTCVKYLTLLTLALLAFPAHGRSGYPGLVFSNCTDLNRVSRICDLRRQPLPPGSTITIRLHRVHKRQHGGMKR
jgi:hypothetical protein